MSALTTAAILGLTAASAGASVAGSLIQGHQAGKAVDAQTEAANKALALQQQQYQQARQDAAPYQQAGQMTLSRLGQMAAQPAQQFSPANYRGGVPTQQGQQQQMPGMQQVGGMQGAGGILGNLAQGGAQLGAGLTSSQMPGQRALGAPPAQAMPGMQPAGAGQGQTVTIQTPDGRTLPGFPRERLAEAMQRGAKVVG